MRQSQRAKAFQLVSTEREPLKPKVGFVYKIEDADSLHKMIKGNRLHGTFKSGDHVLALREKGDEMVYMPFKGNPTKMNDFLEGDAYTTFTTYGKPGPTVCELPAWMIDSLMRMGFAPVAPTSDIDHVNSNSSPGSIQMVDLADKLGLKFNQDKIETPSMKGMLNNGDLVLIIQSLENYRYECALIEPLTLGWREKPDSRFVCQGEPYFGRVAAKLGGHEYLTVTQGGFAYYKDHGRTLDFGKVEILSEVQRGWPQP